MPKNYDVIIVGARCAGAATATFLARGGMRVLMLDMQAAGAPYAMSSHFIQSPGMAVLDELGIGDQIRSKTPATRRMKLAFDAHQAVLNAEPAAYCASRNLG